MKSCTTTMLESLNHVIGERPVSLNQPVIHVLGYDILHDPSCTFLIQQVPILYFDVFNKISHFQLILSVLDVWTTLGHYKSRAIMRLIINVREPYPLVMKSSKFHNSTTYCSLAPLNWVYCPLNTP